jgi:hypothetical protein
MRNVSEAFMRVISIPVLLFGMCVSSGAFSANAPIPEIAILKTQSGKVLVNSGDGFVAATSEVRLKTGDTIMVGTDAVAAVYFPKAKCTAPLATAMVTTVTGSDMCQQAQQSKIPVSGIHVSGTAPIINPVNSGPPPQGEIPPLLIAGGIVVLSAAALIDSFSHNSSASTPVSAP